MDIITNTTDPRGSEAGEVVNRAAEIVREMHNVCRQLDDAGRLLERLDDAGPVYLQVTGDGVGFSTKVADPNRARLLVTECVSELTSARETLWAEYAAHMRESVDALTSR